MSPHCDMSNCEHVCNDMEDCPGFEDFTTSIEFFELKLDLIKSYISLFSDELGGKYDWLMRYIDAKTIQELEAIK